MTPATIRRRAVKAHVLPPEKPSAPILVPRWKQVLIHAWSVKFIVLAVLLSGVEVYMAAMVDDPPFPRGTFAVLSMAVSMAAFVARFIAQRPLSGGGNGK